MRRASPGHGQAGLVAAARALAKRRGAGRWPRLSIWQGGRDRTVAPGNAELLALQWTGLHGLDPAAARAAQPAPGVSHRAWGPPEGPAVEVWMLENMGHGFPIAPARPGGGRPGAWMQEAGVPAAHEIARFWGIGGG